MALGMSDAPDARTLVPYPVGPVEHPALASAAPSCALHDLGEELQQVAQRYRSDPIATGVVAVLPRKHPARNLDARCPEGQKGPDEIPRTSSVSTGTAREFRYGTIGILLAGRHASWSRPSGGCRRPGDPDPGEAPLVVFLSECGRNAWDESGVTCHTRAPGCNPA